MAALAKKAAYKARFAERPPATTFHDIDCMIEEQNAEILTKKKWKSLNLFMQWGFIVAYVKDLSLSQVDMDALKSAFRKKLLQLVDYRVETNTIKFLHFTLLDGTVI